MPQSTEKKIPPLPPLELLSPHEAAIVRQRWDGDPFIPTPKGYALESEATAYFKAADVPNSPYFPQFDFYHMYSHGSLSMLPCFRTYQQTRGYTCASAIALMTLYHFGVTDWEELQIADEMASFHGLPPDTRRPIPVKDLAQFFTSLGWDVETNLECAARAPEDKHIYDPWRSEAAKTFPTLESFADFCRFTIRSGAPIMVENIDWGAHWRMIVGFDDMGTGKAEHGVLILADPHDTADHCQDGFVIEHIDKFYSMWYDIFVMERDECTQPFVVARPPWMKGDDGSCRRM
nr:hypothetical protein [Schwartzia sp. (in: firmicutes)]